MEQFVEFGKADIEQSIPCRFAKQAWRHPNRLAVKAGEDAWSYQHLNGFSTRIAHAIHRLRGDRQETIAVLLNQGAPLVGSILGVLQAGKIYLALDHTYPKARLMWMLDDADTTLILTNDHNLKLAESLATSERRVLNVDELCDGPVEDLSLPIAPDALAYLFYTSGSTGKPKGIADTHRNVLHNVMRYTNNLRIAPCDRLTLLQSASYSGAVSSMFAALLNGASSFPFDLRAENPARLAAWLQEERITIYHSVPVIFRSFLSGNLKFPTLRVIRLEGDAASKIDVELFKKHFLPPCVLANGLGATETGLSCQYLISHDTTLSGGIVPIGYPTPDMDVLVLDEAANGVGEIAVRSEYLAPGYWKRPDLTTSAFIVDASDNRKRTYRTGDMGRRRSDGCIEYFGRKDSQLKIRGNRVEPAEVESALLALDNVKGAVVTTHAGSRGEARLVAYVVPERTPVSPVPIIRRELAKMLPGYMIPTLFEFRDSLPLTENQKIDRRALAPPGEISWHRSTAIVSARNDIELQLLHIWEEELDVRPLGVTDNFFDCGGDSLAAIRLLASVEETYGQTIPLWMFTEAMNVEQVACLIGAKRRSANSSTLVPIQPRGAKPPLFCVHDQNGEVFRFVALSRLLGDTQPLYGVRSVGLCEGEQPLSTIEAMASRYIQDLRVIQPRGPYYLTGFCYGAVVALEMAHQLRARDETVALLSLLSISPFDFFSLMTPLSRLRYRRHLGPAGFFDRVLFHIHEAGSMSISEGARHLFIKATRMPHFLGSAARGRLFRSRTDSQEDAVPPPRLVDAVTQANRRAFSIYVPRPSSGNVVLILDQDVQRRFTPDAAADYRGITSARLTVHIIAGAEHDMMKEPGASELAELLRHHLDANSDSCSSSHVGF